MRVYILFLFVGMADCVLLCRLPTERVTLMATTVIMILHVWAMYNCSKLVLRVHLTLFFVEIISYILALAVANDLWNVFGM